MASRITSTVALWGIILGSLYLFGTPAAVLSVTLFAALAQHEFYAMTARMGARPFRRMGLLFGVLFTTGPFYRVVLFGRPPAGGMDFEPFLLHALLLVALIVATGCRALGERDATSRAGAIASTLLGVLCVPYLLQFLVLILLRDGPGSENLALTLWLVAVSKFCDVGALLCGMAFGRHKLSPHISPQKTWEGAVGGVLVSAGIGAAVAYLAGRHLPASLTPLLAAGLAVPLAVTTILSDLLESVLKRWADTKDSGRLVPGIGGALDLVDSLLLTAPLGFFLFLLLA